MADETDTQDEAQLDEFGYRIPTQKELDAEFARDRRTAVLVNELKQTEADAVAPTGGRWSPPSGVSLGAAPIVPPTLPPGSSSTLINRGGQPSAGTPLPMPTGQGRMYMGPAMSQANESAFMLSPPGTRTNLVPPPSTEMASGAAGRIAAGTGGESDESALARMKAYDQPGSRTIGVSNPPMPTPTMGDIQFSGIQTWQKNKASGMPDAENWRQTGPMILGRIPSATRAPETPPLRNVQGVGYTFDPTTKTWVPVTPPKVLPPKATRAVNKAHDALLASELIAQQSGDPRSQDVARFAREAFEKDHPELGLSPAAAPAGPTARAITPPPLAAPAGVQPASRPAAGAPAVGTVKGGWRFKGGDPSKKANWEKV